MVAVKEVRRSQTNIKIFRSIARDTCGESMEPSSEEKIFFAYGGAETTSPHLVQAVASVKLANPTAPSDQRDHFHWLTFLFVKKDFQFTGIGSKMLDHIHAYLWNFIKRPIRTDSAKKAIGFFKKNSYAECGAIFQCACPGGLLFSNLQTMEKPLPADMVEIWD